MSILKVDTIDTTDGSGNITVSRPTILQAGDIVEADIATDAVTTVKIVDDAVTIAKLAATGTASSSTFLRGDNSWAAPGGGGLIYIATATANVSSSLSFINIPSSGYTNFVFVVQGLYPSTGGRVQMRTSTNNGSSYDSGGSDYAYSTVVYDSTGAWGTITSTGDDVIKISGGNVKSTVADGGYHGIINMSSPDGAVRKKIIHWTGGFVQNTITTNWGTGHRLATTDIDAVNFTTSSSGTFTAGSITLYGMKNS